MYLHVVPAFDGTGLCSMHVGSGGGGGSGGNGGSGGGSASGALVGDRKDEKKKLAPVSITLVSFAVSRKAYTKVKGAMTYFCTMISLQCTYASSSCNNKQQAFTYKLTTVVQPLRPDHHVLVQKCVHALHPDSQP